MKDSAEQFKLAVSVFSKATDSMNNLASAIVQAKAEGDAKFSSSVDDMNAKLEDLVKTIKSEQKNKSRSKFQSGELFSRMLYSTQIMSLKQQLYNHVFLPNRISRR
jgi:predicted transcriptional regulator YheO